MNHPKRLAVIALLAVSTMVAASTPVKGVGELSRIYSMIQKYYVDAPDGEELIQNAIHGMVSGLDPHSAYLEPKEAEDLIQSVQGTFGGLGIQVEMNEDGLVRVISPIDDTPADKAGVKAGDLIIKLDDTWVKGLTMEEAIDKMRGPVGEAIVLTIVRQGEDAPITKTVVRDVIELRSVSARVLEPNFGYLRIASFQEPTGRQVREQLDKLTADNYVLKGLVLDLRNNPGGELDAAVQVAGTFLKGGLVVYTEGRIAGMSRQYNADNVEKAANVPLVVLINEGSASASEIVAGALQDRKRAVIMGRQSFGKGSVQQVLPITGSDARLKLTISRYYTPNGRSIQAKGIAPDVPLPRLNVDVLEPLMTASEANYPRHLDNEEDAGENTTDTVSTPADDMHTPIGRATLLERDYELYQALSMLQGLTIHE